MHLHYLAMTADTLQTALALPFTTSLHHYIMHGHRSCTLNVSCDKDGRGKLGRYCANRQGKAGQKCIQLLQFGSRRRTDTQRQRGSLQEVIVPCIHQGSDKNKVLKVFCVMAMFTIKLSWSNFVRRQLLIGHVS